MLIYFCQFVPIRCVLTGHSTQKHMPIDYLKRAQKDWKFQESILAEVFQALQLPVPLIKGKSFAKMVYMATILGERNHLCSFELGENKDLAGLTKITISNPQSFLKLLGISSSDDQDVSRAFKDCKFVNLGFDFCKETLVLKYNPERRSVFKNRNKRNRPSAKYHPYKKAEEVECEAEEEEDLCTEMISSKGGISIDALLN